MCVVEPPSGGGIRTHAPFLSFRQDATCLITAEVAHTGGGREIFKLAGKRRKTLSTPVTPGRVHLHPSFYISPTPGADRAT